MSVIVGSGKVCLFFFPSHCGVGTSEDYCSVAPPLAFAEGFLFVTAWAVVCCYNKCQHLFAGGERFSLQNSV